MKRKQTNKQTNKQTRDCRPAGGRTEVYWSPYHEINLKSCCLLDEPWIWFVKGKWNCLLCRGEQL